MKTKSALATLVLLYGSFVGLGLWLASKLFEYSLWVLTGKDAPWYMDVLGGILCNGFLVVTSFILWMMTTFLGYTSPIFH